MKRLKIAGVVILYNPNNNYIDNIKSYINDIDKLYVVDNSPKKNKIFNDKKIEYIFNNENLGIAIPLNQIASKAIKEGYNWLLTMDQDTFFNDNVLNEMKDYILNHDTEKDGIVTVWHNTKLDVIKPKVKIDYPITEMTSGNLVNLDIWKKVNGYEEKFFIDGIDIEYCLRLKKCGYRVVRLNNVEILHDLGDIKYYNFLGKKYLCTNHNYIRKYYIMRNYNYIKEKYYDIDPKYCEPLNHLKLRLFRVIMFEKDKYRKIRNMFRGIKDYKKGIIGKYPYNN